MQVAAWAAENELVDPATPTRFGLAGLVAAAALVIASARALLVPAPVLGRALPCTRAQLVNGDLRCDAELLGDRRELCPLGPRRPLAAGDAVEPEDCLTPGARGSGRMPPDQLAALGQPVELNSASAAELASLPGIGPALAQRILARRPYVDVDALIEVRGIGPKRLAAVRRRAFVDREPVRAPRASRSR